MLIANGADTTGLIALIPEDTDSDKRDITFKTTVGRFKTGGNELTVRATPSKEMYPGKLVARATFKADTNTSPASVTATVKSYTTKPETITFIRSYAQRIQGDTDKQILWIGDSQGERAVLTAFSSNHHRERQHAHR